MFAILPPPTLVREGLIIAALGVVGAPPIVELDVAPAGPHFTARCIFEQGRGLDWLDRVGDPVAEDWVWQELLRHARGHGWVWIDLPELVFGASASAGCPPDWLAEMEAILGGAGWDPAWHHMASQIAKVLERNGRYESALQLLKQARERIPFDRHRRYRASNLSESAARVAARAGEPERALELMQGWDYVGGGCIPSAVPHDEMFAFRAACLCAAGYCQAVEDLVCAVRNQNQEGIGPHLLEAWFKCRRKTFPSRPLEWVTARMHHLLPEDALALFPELLSSARLRSLPREEQLSRLPEIAEIDSGLTLSLLLSEGPAFIEATLDSLEVPEDPDDMPRLLQQLHWTGHPAVGQRMGYVAKRESDEPPPYQEFPWHQQRWAWGVWTGEQGYWPPAN